MSLHLLIKKIIALLCLMLSLFASAQDEDKLDSKNEAAAESSIFSSRERQTFVVLSNGFNLPITAGNNFIGQGLEGNSGLDFGFQLYLYKQFFIGFSLNYNFFDVKDQSVVGNYKKTKVNEELLNIGYEFLPTDKLRLGVVASVTGSARFKNKQSSGSNQAYQIDHSRLSNYGIYIRYELNSVVMVYLDYAYSIAKTDIMVPNELEDVFRKGAYNNVGIGLAFNIGKRDLISRFLN
ncbi:hypothetical protein [Winogradskyella wichelsiae]|uniref:hypothetical protein n=1 Tax=Winogradskyella wichelsiae TaxID=2697007 RepID=UPI0015C706FB|nr:hypothetical protein [Winogradskyella wichelsiae]